MIECKHCSTVLPSDALFCGECGRAVPSARTESMPVGPRPLTAPVPQPEPWTNVLAGGVCEQCGLPVQSDDIFCGECGFVVNSAVFSGRKHDDGNQIVSSEPSEPRVETDPVETDPVDSESTEVSRDEVETQSDGERYVLQFSTGESFTVFGSGLIGRSPKPEPGEYFDQLIRIVDASRSVSKTHLEFGQEAGFFWVKDRFSGNGSSIREPESDPVRCRPDRRYRLVRGSRVDLGEQFFVVS